MDNKLQELTDKLYNEGLSKGKQEAEALKAAAAKESEQIISEARKERRPTEYLKLPARRPRNCAPAWRAISGWPRPRPSPHSANR